MLVKDARIVGLAVGFIASLTPELLPLARTLNTIRIVVAAVAILLGIRLKGELGGFLFGLGTGIALAGLVGGLTSGPPKIVRSLSVWGGRIP